MKQVTSAQPLLDSKFMSCGFTLIKFTITLAKTQGLHFSYLHSQSLDLLSWAPNTRVLISYIVLCHCSANCKLLQYVVSFLFCCSDIVGFKVLFQLLYMFSSLWSWWHCHLNVFSISVDPCHYCHHHKKLWRHVNICLVLYNVSHFVYNNVSIYNTVLI